MQKTQMTTDWRGDGITKHGCIEPGLVLSNSFGFGHFLFFSRSLVTEDEIRDGGHRGKVEYVIRL